MMKTKWILPVIFALSLCLIFASPVMAQSPTPQPNGGSQGDKVVLGETYRLQSGETLTGNLVVIGGTAAVENNASITGDIVLIGGTVNIEGTVNGNLVAAGGAITLGDRSVVNGDIVTAGASLKKSDTATVTGTITEQTPSVDLGQGTGWHFPWQTNENILSRLLAVTFESLAMAALAAVIGLVLPKQTQCIANTIRTEPLISGGVGLLFVVGSPILMVILIVTILLIPAALIYAIAFALGGLFGWVALGHFLGEKVANLIHVNWAEPVISGIGVLLLSLFVGLFSLIPCVGWIIGFILGLLGLGAVALTKFGSKMYTTKPQAISTQTPPPPPAPGSGIVPPAGL